jgi:hypothetical protein
MREEELEELNKVLAEGEQEEAVDLVALVDLGDRGDQAVRQRRKMGRP